MSGVTIWQHSIPCGKRAYSTIGVRGSIPVRIGYGDSKEYDDGNHADGIYSGDTQEHPYLVIMRNDRIWLYYPTLAVDDDAKDPKSWTLVVELPITKGCKDKPVIYCCKHKIFYLQKLEDHMTAVFTANAPPLARESDDSKDIKIEMKQVGVLSRGSRCPFPEVGRYLMSEEGRIYSLQEGASTLR